MSVVVVVKKGGQAVIAADTLYSMSRTKIRHRYATGRSKIVEIGGGFAGTVGSSAHQHVVRSLAKHHADKIDFSSVDAIFESLRALQPTLADDYFIRTDEDDETQEYDSNQLDLLLCNPHGIFGALSYREVCEYDRFWAHGSGFVAALAAMFAVYDTLPTAEAIARIGIEAACEFDEDCQLPMHLHTVELTERP